MKKKHNTIEERLSGTKFRDLSVSEREILWQRISSAIEPRPIISPWFLPTKFKTKTMIPLIIVAIMFTGAGGTAVLANSSKPGDTLFAVDRATEKVRLAFADKDKSAELKARFAEERLGEVEGLIAIFRVASSTDSVKVVATSTATSTTPSTATRTATSTPNRKNNDRVALGVNIALAYLNEVSADLALSGNVEAQARVEAVITRLEQLINSDDVKVKLKNNGDFQLKLKSGSSTATSSDNVKINTSGNKDRIEIREDGDRIRIEIKKDSEVRFKTNSEDDSDDEDDDDSRRRGKGSDDDEDEDDNDDKVEIKIRGDVNLGL